MAFDEGLAERLRELLADRDDVREKRMFGGLAYLVGGNLCCGILKDRLMARVGASQYEAALQRPHAREMDFTGRPMRGFVLVEPAGFEDDDDLRQWLSLCLGFVESLAR